MKIDKLYISVPLIAAIVVVLNLVSGEFSFRLDLTEDKQYTLSDATRDILRELDDPITITAYFSEDLPPNVAHVRNDFMDMLIEYNNLSKGTVVYEFLNPNDDEEVEKKAVQSGIQPVMINVREKDQMKQQKAYLGAILEQGEDQEVLPFIQPGSAMEYALSSAIKKLSVKDKPVIGMLQGHGEPPIQELIEVSQSLNVLYNLEPLVLTDTTEIPGYIRTIAMVRPADTIPQEHFDQLDRFLGRGGRLFIAFNRVEGDLQQAYGYAQNLGVENWLARKGLLAEDHFVIDASCASVNVQQQQGMIRFTSTISFPYLPVIGNFADHPITQGLEAVVMQFASPLTYAGDTTLHFTPLLYTSERTGSLKAPQYFDVQKQWTENDFPSSGLVTGGVLEGPIAGTVSTKMVVITDGDFVVNGPRGQAQQLQPDNVSLMVNGIDWLSDDTGLIELRTRSITSRPIKEMEDSTKMVLKYLNFLLPIILVILYGLFSYQASRNRRVKRLEENYG